VVHVESTDDVVKAVNISRKHLVPIVAYSGGTSTEGSIAAPAHASGSLCVDLSRMNNILEINEADSDVICQAGVQWNVLNDVLKDKGIPLFFPLDPGIGATVGGMIAQGCSGTNAVKYGTARAEYIINLTAVLPSGEVIKTRQRARKSSVGFDLAKLFTGAEGTLGIVTEVTLRLVPLLPWKVAIAAFDNVDDATQAVLEALNKGASIQCAELVDSICIRAMNTYGTCRLKWPETDSVLFKYAGTPAAIAETAELVRDVVAKYGTGAADGRYTFVEKDADADALWVDRKSLAGTLSRLHPGYKGWVTDLCVPVSRLPDLIKFSRAEFDRLGLIAPIMGHVGDGNFHAFILASNDEEYQKRKEVFDTIAWKAIELDGTCTGEHGVGTVKKKYLPRELGDGTIALMRSIKQTLDPLNLFNPGKLYPDDES